MDSTNMSYCRMYNVICNNRDALRKTSYIRSALHHMVWQLCTQRWKQVSDFGQFSCNSQIATGGTNAQKPANGPCLAPDESSRTLLPRSLQSILISSAAYQHLSSRCERLENRFHGKHEAYVSVFQDRTPISTWHSEDRASRYNLIITANEMHYFSTLFW
jgi:hypothetical protein